MDFSKPTVVKMSKNVKTFVNFKRNDKDKNGKVIPIYSYKRIDVVKNQQERTEKHISIPTVKL